MFRCAGDEIRFESRAELGELLVALEVFLEEHKNAKQVETVKQLRDILDQMEFEW